MVNRREFIRFAGTAALMASFGAWPAEARKSGGRRLVILHTNDVHSHLDPFPDNHPQFPGMGGVARRKALVDAIRAEGHPVLLVDAGDIFQGTPYFNFFNGEPEILMMNRLGYDAVTLGNHDFDRGLDNLATQVQKARFSFLCANYRFSNNVLNSCVNPYRVIEREGVRVGLFGLGIELNGLVPEHLYEGTVYNDPIESATVIARHLKKREGCHLVVALSHLGYKYPDSRPSDVLLAENTENIDVIIGGHTHTFMDRPDIRKNVRGEEVMIHQAGWAGVMLGRIDVHFEKKMNKNLQSAQTVIVDKKSIAF